MCYKWVRPLLFALPAEAASHFTLNVLSLYERFFPYKKTRHSTVERVMGINFPSRVGLAAGLDKNGDCIAGLAKLGFGFIEVGTVTPEPQLGNEKPRVFRLVQDLALINRMGFPNKGVDHLIEQIKQLKHKPILGINIGKNATTPIEEALIDYSLCFEKVYPYADYVVINVSSPNTAQLRELQEENQLYDLLTSLKKQQQHLQHLHRRYVPLVIKLSPDLTSDQVQSIAKVCLGTGIDGVILTNTTLSREGIQPSLFSTKPGGLSGAPLFEKSTQLIKAFHAHFKGRIPIIAAGGICSAEDAQKKCDAGASLVQVYTGLIYEGPGLISAISQRIDHSS